MTLHLSSDHYLRTHRTTDFHAIVTFLVVFFGFFSTFLACLVFENTISSDLGLAVFTNDLGLIVLLAVETYAHRC